MAQSLFGKGIGTDRVHNGIIQGGNKSMHSYRTDYGIPGYTGFIPSSACIPPPVKGSIVHIGREPEAGAQKRLLIAEVGDARTLHKTEMPKYSGAVYGTNLRREDGGYWIQDGHRDRAENLLPNKLQGKTVYKASFESPCVQGEREVLKERQQETVSRTTEPSNWRAQAMYRTSYGETTHKNPLVGGEAAAGKFLKRTQSAPPEATHPSHGNVPGRRVVSSQSSRAAQEELYRDLRGPGCMLAGRYSSTSKHSMYVRTYGPRGRDPLNESVRLERNSDGITELNLGTAKGSGQLPAYSGFMPANGPLPPGYTNPRPAEKSEMLLHSLNQYSRGHLPQYQGFKPLVASNIRNWQGPSKDTTQGEVNAVVVKAIATPGASSCRGKIPKEHQRVNPGIMDLFATGSSISYSDNGKALAERYFHILRPKEGLPRIEYPSKTAAAGYLFKN